MKKKPILPVLILLFVLVLTACAGTVQTVEVTRVIPQTVIVTQKPQATATTSLKTATPIGLAAEPDQDTAYYDGIIVLAQFYTLYGKGLYTEAYQLFSAATARTTSLEEFTKNAQMLRIKTSKLVTAQPYYEWAKTMGFTYSQDSDLMKRFYMRVYAEGEGEMAGAVPNGIHTYFATVVWEKSEWKIYSIGTAP